MMNTESAHTNNQNDSNEKLSQDNKINLPEPDPDNITVLAHNLPNKPILPWNRYDSPWDDPEAPTGEENNDAEELLLEEESKATGAETNTQEKELDEVE